MKTAAKRPRKVCGGFHAASWTDSRIRHFRLRSASCRHGTMTGKGGFSVIEALAATALLAVAMIPIYDMLSALHTASERLERATQTPFIEATALTLLAGPDPRDTEPEESGELTIGGWRVEWQRRALSATGPAGAAYGTEMIDIRLEELELVLIQDNYRQRSLHRRIAWTPRHDSLEAYMETLQ